MYVGKYKKLSKKTMGGNITVNSNFYGTYLEDGLIETPQKICQ